MKRTSVVGPLLLIVIGALFLARNLYQDLPLIDYLARYWPYLLIVWGGLRLVEIMLWAATSKPLPTSGVSGGEWVLVIFLCVFGSGLYAVRGFSRDWLPDRIQLGGLEMFGENYEYPIAGQIQAGKTPRIIIENFRGNARITGSAVEEVKVSGRKSVRSLDQTGADKANTDTPFEVLSEGGNIVIRTNQDRLGERHRISHDLELTVPTGSSIEGRGRAGDFDITDLTGTIEIASDSAGVRLNNIAGAIRVDLRRSDIIRVVNAKNTVELRGRGNDLELQNIEGQVTIDGTYTGVLQFRNLVKPLRFTGPTTDLAIEKIPGYVRMALGDLTGSEISGPIRLTAKNKDVQLSEFTQNLEIQLDRGDIELRPSKTAVAKMDVRTRSGNIDLALPQAAKFEMRATTNRGEIVNDWGAPLRVESEGRGASLKGTVGAGPTVTLSTDRGEISIRRLTADDEKNVRFPGIPDAPESPQPAKALKQ